MLMVGFVAFSKGANSPVSFMTFSLLCKTADPIMMQIIDPGF